MISPIDRKKMSFSLRPSHNAEMKKYEEVYFTYANTGYNKDLCEQYAETFVDNVKKPNPFDMVQLAVLYERIHDYKTAYFYLEQLADKKLGGAEKFAYCIETLRTLSLLGKWRDAIDFRTDNINVIFCAVPDLTIPAIDRSCLFNMCTRRAAFSHCQIRYSGGGYFIICKGFDLYQTHKENSRILFIASSSRFQVHILPWPAVHFVL